MSSRGPTDVMDYHNYNGRYQESDYSHGHVVRDSPFVVPTLQSQRSNYFAPPARQGAQPSQYVPTTPSGGGRGPSNLVLPSDIYGRPQPPSEMEFHFGDDDVSTIAPGDSVSQLGRRLTNHHNGRVVGPRPMDAIEGSPDSNPTPRMPSPGAPTSPLDGYHIVDAPRTSDIYAAPLPPDRLPSPGASRTAPMTSQSYTDPEPPTASTEDGRTLIRAIPSPAPYAKYEDNEDIYDRRGMMNPTSPSKAPLVANSAPYGQGGGGGSVADRLRNLPAGAGYAPLNPREEDDGSVYHGTRDDDRSIYPGTRIADDSMSSSRWIDPLDYNDPGRSAHGDPYFDPRYDLDHDYESGKDTYPPDLYDSKRKSSRDGTIEPLDVVERQSTLMEPSLMRTPSLWQRMLYDGKTPLAVRIAEHKKGLGLQKRPWACWLLAVTFAVVLIVELVRMYQYTGSPIQTKPSFNVMIGPSGSVLINTGARFPGCQKYIANITDIEWICLKDSNKPSTATFDTLCTMSEICGFGGFPTPQDADQSFRFVLPIFLHAGVVHLLVNMLAQVEKQMGTPKFIIVYFLSGIFGFVLGSNFALVGQPSVGASGAIFGTHAAILVDLLAHWNIEYRPVRKLIYLIIELVVGLALGLVPGVDNFAHIGGFCMGLLTSILLLPIIHQSKRHRVVFIVLRLIALPLVVVLFVVLVRNFYVGDPAQACSWCRYLSCWPTASNNRCKGTGLSTVTSSSIAPTFLSILVSTFVLPLM